MDPRCMIRVRGSQETNPGLSHNRIGVIPRKIWPRARDRAKIMLLTTRTRVFDAHTGGKQPERPGRRVSYPAIDTVRWDITGLTGPGTCLGRPQLIFVVMPLFGAMRLHETMFECPVWA